MSDSVDDKNILRLSTRREFGKFALGSAAGVFGVADSGAAPASQSSAASLDGSSDQDEDPLRHLSFRPISGGPIAEMPADALHLHAEWRLQSSKVVPATGEALSKPGTPTPNWYATTVPSTVLTALVVNGVYPDPYIGLNNMRIPDASDALNARYGLAQYSHLPDGSNPWSAPYWYCTEFVVPKRFTEKVIWLNFAGINYRADVWLNGHQIASAIQTVGMFQRFRFNVTPYLQPEARACLAVRIYPVDIPGDPVYEQIELMGGFGPNGGDGEISRNVTDIASIGWDWVPAARDRNMGIWQDVWLDVTGPVTVRDPFVVTKLLPPGTDAARLTVRLALQNAFGTGVQAHLKVQIEPGNFKAPGQIVELETSVSIQPEAALDVTLTPEEFPQLVIRSPKLWWPVNYGEQNLYRISIEASVNGVKSSEVQSHFGIREFTSTIFPTGGRAFYVNKRKIRITGGAWIPDFLLNWGAQRYQDEARLIASGNHTMVRVNGCSITAPDVFYAACDRLGILIWQEFWRTSVAAGWSPKPCNPAIFMSCARDTIRRVRNHPSLVMWSASNEAYPQRDIYEPLAEAMQELDGTRLLLPSSGGKDPEWAKVKSEVYTGGPWKWVPEKEYFDLYANEREFGFRDEVGLPSMPDINTIRKAIPDYNKPSSNYSAYYPANIAMSYHDLDDRTSHDAMLSRFGRPVGIAEYALRGQIINTDSYRAIFEAMNKNFRRNSGTLLWKTNAAWPSFMWQLYDWYLRANAGYYSMKRACRPIHVQFNEDDNSVSVISIRDQTQRDLSIGIDLFDADLHSVLRDRKKVSVEPDRSVPVMRLPAFSEDAPLHFLRLALFDRSGSELDRNIYWISPRKNFDVLSRLPPVELTVTVLEYSTQGQETVLHIAISNPSASIALQINPAVLKGAGGEEVLPTFWSDNYISLLPKEQQQLTARFRSTLLNGATPHLICEGWNVVPALYDLSARRRVPLSCEVTALQSRGSGPKMQSLGAILRQSGDGGSRITTWPVAIESGHRVLRTFRVGLSNGEDHSVQVPMQLPTSGAYTVSVGTKTASITALAAGAYLDAETFQIQARAFASGTAGSSSPAYAIDGVATTLWTSPPKDPQWLAVDLGAPFLISKVTLNWDTAFAIEYKIQIAMEDSNWKDVLHEQNGVGGQETKSFPAVEARYVRVLGTKSAGGSGISLREITME